VAGFVLDSFALLALLQAEPGAERVRQLLEEADRGEQELYISSVNFGEVFYNVEDRYGEDAARELAVTLNEAPLHVVEVDRALALVAARLKAGTGVGYLDCFVAALAQQLGLSLVTGDPDFRRLEGRVQIEWLPADDTQ
jgi:predicted nucleic acid-binding protein